MGGGGGQWEVVFEDVLLRGILTYYNSITNTKYHNTISEHDQSNLT